MHFCNETKLYYKFVISGFIVSIDNVGENYTINTLNEPVKEFIDEDEAQAEFYRLLDKEDDDYDGYELEQHYFHDEEGTQMADVNTVESGELSN